MSHLDEYVAITRSEDDDTILAGGGLDGNVIKCVAVSEDCRAEGFTNKLISRLLSIAHERGFDSVKLYTKPSNLEMFESLGFTLLAKAPQAVLMENGRGGLREYQKYLATLRRPGKNGVIVMNANPFTLGHRYLVEMASALVDNLYVIAVKEDLSRFPYSERLDMIETGCRDLENVTVCQGSDYAISAATFPTYFLKRLETASDTQMLLDLDLFAKQIAPQLGVSVRFAGTEPNDQLTARYNSIMSSTLPSYGIDFVEIPRLENADAVVSATQVRKNLDEGLFSKAAAMVCPTTVPYLLSDLACQALKMELDSTPKPGLVDKQDSGAHEDMDYSTMSASIKALRPYFSKIAVESFETLNVRKVQEAGVQAESAMLAATAGVNTHKGALFCIGLALAAASHLASFGKTFKEADLRNAVSALSGEIAPAKDTHGAKAVKNYKVPGALENARRAYPELFSEWLPFYRNHITDEYCLQKTLLKIMTTLDDTNIIHRKGLEELRKVQTEASTLLAAFSRNALEALNKDYISRGISPGGSADMLSLTIFISTIFN